MCHARRDKITVHLFQNATGIANEHLNISFQYDSALIKWMLKSGIFFSRANLHTSHGQFLSELRHALDSRSEFLQIHKID